MASGKRCARCWKVGEWGSGPLLGQSLRERFLVILVGGWAFLSVVNRGRRCGRSLRVRRRHVVRAVDSTSGAETRVVAAVTIQKKERGWAEWVVRVPPFTRGRASRHVGCCSVVPVSEGPAVG